MADLSDVETTLATLIETVLYPSGPAAASLLGPLIRIYRGWPNQAALDADLAAGNINVSIFAEPGTTRNTTRYPAEFGILTPANPSLAVSVVGTTATFSGTATPNHLAGLLADGISAVYRTVAGDTPALVAAILAGTLRSQGMIAQLSGAAVTVPAATDGLIARVVVDQPAQMETRRQRQNFRVTCWCPDPASRDATAGAIDAALSMQTFIALPDTSSGRLRYRGTSEIDRGEDASLYRRDLVYSVEYPTTLNANLPEMIFGVSTIAPDNGPVLTSRTS